MFRRMDSISVFRYNLVYWDQSSKSFSAKANKNLTPTAKEEEEGEEGYFSCHCKANEEAVNVHSRITRRRLSHILDVRVFCNFSSDKFIKITLL